MVKNDSGTQSRIICSSIILCTERAEGSWKKNINKKRKTPRACSNSTAAVAMCHDQP